jgi:type I restriction enzyme M protein
MIQKWLQRRRDSLREKFGNSNFRFDDAVKVLKEKHQDAEDQVNVVLSELRKKGWLEVSFDPKDARRRIYKLKSIEEVISETLLAKKNRLTRGDLETLLKKAADLIRTRVDYTFILVLLFYKRISDKWEIEFEQAYKEALADGLSEEEAKEEAKNSIYHDFDIPEEFLWEKIRKDPARIPENLSKAMKALAERNSELKDVFENVDFVQFTTNQENAEILRQLVELFSARPLYHVSPDILGDAYEWILRYFAPQKAKEGEVYTPREVIKLIVEALDPQPEESVYDPACGSAGMLICAYQHVEDEQGKAEAGKLFLFGQEANHKTLALAKMNLFIHDIRNAQLTLGDTLLYPKFKEKERIKKFNVVIANPPWNQDGYAEEILKRGEFWRERYRFGVTPRQSADWAWIQHMLASAKNDTGRVGVVIDNGCLFRGGKEKAVRMGVLNADLIEAVILLPEKLFYNTGAPGAIIILNKNKPAERKEKVLFINASQEYEQHPDVRKLNRLGDNHIEKIVKAYKEFKDTDGFSRIVSLEEIKENDYNLNVTLYVFPEEEIEEIDVAGEWEELRTLEDELAHLENKIEGYLKKLGSSV